MKTGGPDGALAPPPPPPPENNYSVLHNNTTDFNSKIAPEAISKNANFKLSWGGMPPDPSKKAHSMEACPHYLACTKTDGLQLSHFYLHVSFAVYHFMSEGPGMHIYGSNPWSDSQFSFLSLYR